MSAINEDVHYGWLTKLPQYLTLYDLSFRAFVLEVQNSETTSINCLIILIPSHKYVAPVFITFPNKTAYTVTSDDLDIFLTQIGCLAQVHSAYKIIHGNTN